VAASEGAVEDGRRDQILVKSSMWLPTFLDDDEQWQTRKVHPRLSVDH
jgi:hypothetical protein